MAINPTAVQMAGIDMVYEIDPTVDFRWERLVVRHPQASVFHTREWLEALKRTYGYAPVAFTTSDVSDPLTNGIPFCRIAGLFGKRRLVSLPFSDHCQPLVEAGASLNTLTLFLEKRRKLEGWD